MTMKESKYMEGTESEAVRRIIKLWQRKGRCDQSKWAPDTFSWALLYIHHVITNAAHK